MTAKFASSDKVAAEFVANGYKIITSFEKQYTCAGVCFLPLFYLTKDLSAGPPTTQCDDAFLKSVQGNTGAAIGAFVTALLFLTLFGASFVLCTGKSDPNDADRKSVV